MATYSQDSQKLVLVGTEFVPDTTGTAIDALTVGQIGMYYPDGTGLNASAAGGAFPGGQSVILAMGTGKPPIGSTNGAVKNLSLVSETIHPGMIVQNLVKTAAQPSLQAERIAVGTAIPNNEYYLTADFDGYGSTSVQNTVQQYAVFVSTSTSTAQDIATGLADNFNKNASRAGVGRARAYAVGAGLGATTPKGVVAAANEVVIEAQMQSVIDFNNMFHPVTFKVTLNGSFAADAVLTNVSASNKGFGYGPEVANIEHFAQGSEANWYWGRFNEMYPRDLYTDSTKSYDCTSVRLKTVKEGYGSNVSSFRLIDCFVDGAATTTAQAEQIQIALGLITGAGGTIVDAT